MTAPVVLSGATGLLGRGLAAALARDGAAVRALSRNPERAAAGLPSGVEPVWWDGISIPGAALRGARAVVHLAGEPLFGGLPSRARLRRIRSSRVDSTLAIARQLAALAPGEGPASFVCASAVGIYGDAGERELAEDAPPGRGFVAELCADWESAARSAQPARVVSLRLGIVLSREGGALPLMARPFRIGVGGRLGSGRQWVPWIHREDAIALLRLALENEAIRGPLNAVSPGAVRNAELSAALARVLGRPALLPVPALALRLALRELSGELLDSRRVVPRAAQAAGHRFAFPDLESALRAELG